ncbi:MAG: hypothetical protein WDW38_009295 [Sanguina aurantia]
MSLRLVEVIGAVPSLVQACSAALESPNSPGSGLKSLRLLSSAFKHAMSCSIHGCTVQLGSNAPHNLSAVVHLLRHSQLSRLRLTVLQPQSGTSTSQDAELVLQQLNAITTELGPALQHVTRLELDVQDACSDSDSSSSSSSVRLDASFTHPSTLSSVLVVVAHACPAVRQLRVAGNIGRAVLQHLGAYCPHLASLEVVCEDVPLASLEDMHLLLPHLTHLTLLPPSRAYTATERVLHGSRIDHTSQVFGNRVLAACQACMGLTDIHAPWVMEGHTHLAPRVLHASLAMQTHHGFRGSGISSMAWSSLRSLTVHASHVDVYHLARLARQAPQLLSLCVVCASGQEFEAVRRVALA